MQTSAMMPANADNLTALQLTPNVLFVVFISLFVFGWEVSVSDGEKADFDAIKSVACGLPLTQFILIVRFILYGFLPILQKFQKVSTVFFKKIFKKN
jgi:hypothetical protein